MNIIEIPIVAIKEIELYDVIILHLGFENYKRDYFIGFFEIGLVVMTKRQICFPTRFAAGGLYYI